MGKLVKQTSTKYHLHCHTHPSHVADKWCMYVNTLFGFDVAVVLFPILPFARRYSNNKLENTFISTKNNKNTKVCLIQI